MGSYPSVVNSKVILLSSEEEIALNRMIKSPKKSQFLRVSAEEAGRSTFCVSSNWLLNVYPVVHYATKEISFIPNNKMLAANIKKATERWYSLITAAIMGGKIMEANPEPIVQMLNTNAFL